MVVSPIQSPGPKFNRKLNVDPPVASFIRRSGTQLKYVDVIFDLTRLLQPFVAGFRGSGMPPRHRTGTQYALLVLWQFQQRPVRYCSRESASFDTRLPDSKSTVNVPRRMHRQENVDDHQLE
jgi:hypothetical protein